MIALAIQTTLTCLKELYAATGGDHWNDNSGWNQDEYCLYHGVLCRGFTVEELNLSGNNLVGKLPACFAEIPAKLIDLSSNNLEGDFPNVNKSVLSLNIMNNRFTSYPPNWCEDAETFKEMFYIAGNPIEQVDVPACILQAYYLNISGLKLTFLEQDFVFNSTIFLAAGADMNLVTVNFYKVENLTQLDLSNTKVHSFPYDFFRMENTPNLKVLQVGGAYIYLHGKIPPLVTKVDISDCYMIDNQFNLTQLDERFTEFIAKNASLLGITPSIMEYEHFMTTRNTLINLEDNNFICRPDGQDAFDCQLLQLVHYDYQKGMITVHIKLGNNRITNMEFIDHNFTLAIKDLSNEDPNVVKLFYYNNCKVYELGDCQRIQCLDDGQQPLPAYMDYMQNVVVLYNGMQASTESLLVYQDIQDLLKNPIHETFNDYSIPITLYENDFSGDYEMAVTAMSNCPDFGNIVMQTLWPFANKYRALKQHISFRFVSMSTPTGYYNGKATSMHGQREVYHDGLLTCANRYGQDEKYMDFLRCFIDKEYDPKCVDGVFDDGTARNVDLCAYDEYIDFLAESRALVLKLGASWSPTMYLKKRDSATYTKICQDCLYGADQMKDILCDFMAESHYPECEQ